MVEYSYTITFMGIGVDSGIVPADTMDDALNEVLVNDELSGLDDGRLVITLEPA